MKTKKSIERYITRRGLCTGCGICNSIFDESVLKIKMNKTGFYRPVFLKDISKQQWEQFLYLCPALNMNYKEYSNGNVPLFGTAVECRIGWSASEEIRFKASSGGGVTSFLVFLLENKIVDGVIHVGRSDNQFIAEGMLSTNSDQIKNNIGSLYMPVSMLSNVKDLLDRVDKVAIVGKGCDIRAIRRFAEINPEYRSKICLCIGILCGGTPSIKGTYKILEDFNMKPDDITTFRYRGYGWPGFFTAVSNDNEEKTMTYNEAWAKKLGPTSPLVCKVCFDGIAESADIVFGDAWKCKAGNYPSFDETDGRNLIICRNSISKELLYEAVSRGYLVLDEEIVDNELFKIIQPSQSNRRYLAKLKIIGLRISGLSYPRVNMKYLNQLSLSSGVKITVLQKLRTICGSIKRLRMAKEEE